MDKVENASEKTALEIGCGTGLFTTRLSKKLKEVACFDTSEGMIQVLKEKIQNENIKNIFIYVFYTSTWNQKSIKKSAISIW
ncbi:MAG: class I SAM-dependent methyltransferase [Clostridium sp.]|nr:class I SAM-dependent methyltransferase [Clostridium sp.]